jgi:hypothetical protein
MPGHRVPQYPGSVPEAVPDFMQVPPPPAYLAGARIVCKKCWRPVANLITEQVSTRRGDAERWTLVDADGTDLGRHAAQLRCPKHGSCGTWKAHTLASRARAVWDSLGEQSQKSSGGTVPLEL